jgi:hypothetical protein
MWEVMPIHIFVPPTLALHTTESLPDIKEQNWWSKGIKVEDIGFEPK